MLVLVLVLVLVVVVVVVLTMLMLLLLLLLRLRLLLLLLLVLVVVVVFTVRPSLLRALQVAASICMPSHVSLVGGIGAQAPELVHCGPCAHALEEGRPWLPGIAVSVVRERLRKQ